MAEMLENGRPAAGGLMGRVRDYGVGVLSWMRANPWARAAIVVAVCCFAGYALYERWGEARSALLSMPLWALPASVGAALAGLVAQMLAWRALLADLGSPLPVTTAARVMFLGQLGKYLPGSVWAVLAQVELARDHGVSRLRGAGATVLAIVVTVAVNLSIAAAALPLLSAPVAARWGWAVTCVPLLLVLVQPRVATWLLRLASRLMYRSSVVTPGESDRVSRRGMAIAVGWSLAAWLPLAAHVWVLAAGAGARGMIAIPVAAGAYALAWSLGLLLVVVPAGIGVREAVLVVGLTPVLDPGSALVVAGLSRLVTTIADLTCAGVSLLGTPRPTA